MCFAVSEKLYTVAKELNTFLFYVLFYEFANVRGEMTQKYRASVYIWGFTLTVCVSYIHVNLILFSFFDQL